MSDFESSIWDRDDELYEQDEVQDSIFEEDDEGDEIFEEEFEDFDEELLAEEQSLIIDSAELRLEKGRLYKMLIEHRLFDGVDAAPEAVASVEEEIKDFIVERLEVLLGMRAEKEREVQHIVQEPQFNDLEVQVLKRLANKVSKGMTESAPTTAPASKPSQLNTVKKQVAKPKINALSAQKQKVSKPRLPKPAPQPTAAPLRKAPKKKPKRKLKKDMLEKSSKSIVEAAKKDVKYLESLKNMSLEEAAEVVAQRHQRPKAKTQLNYGDEQQNQDVINSHYTNKMTNNETANTFSVLLAAAKKARE